MKILVTGANGFAGRHLLKALLQRSGVEIVAGSLDGSPAPGLETSPVHWVALDIRSEDSVRSVVRGHGPDRVFHLAGQSSVSQSFATPLLTWEINATGTLRLLHALGTECDHRVRVLIVSSAEVYGAVDQADQPIREDQPLRPITPYGASKVAMEVVALQMAAIGALDVVVARSFNHIGPGQATHFALPSMAQQLGCIRRGEAPPVLRVGNLEARRDFLDVRDVVEAYMVIMDRGASGGVYNVCSGEHRTLLDMVERLVRLSGTGARLEVDPERFRPADIPVLVGDASRLRALGWEPRVPLDQTLTDLLKGTEAESLDERG